MIRFEGQMITGTFDEAGKIYTLEQVKHLTTRTVLHKEQLEEICKYLEYRRGEANQILSLNDQILLSLSKEEIAQLIEDLHSVQKFYSERNQL